MNIDHIATIREARKRGEPEPVAAEVKKMRASRQSAVRGPPKRDEQRKRAHGDALPA